MTLKIPPSRIDLKDIEENDVAEERAEPGDRRDHRRLQKPVDESSGIGDEHSRGFLVPNCFLQNLVERRSVDGIGEQTAHEHHEGYDNRSRVRGGNGEQNVGQDAAWD